MFSVDSGAGDAVLQRLPQMPHPDGEKVLAREGRVLSYFRTERCGRRDMARLGHVGDWLKASTGETPRAGIIHGDHGVAITSFDQGPPARLAAMIGWEPSTIGEPLRDLGWAVYTFRPRDGAGLPSALYNCDACPFRWAPIVRYADGTGLLTDDIDCYRKRSMFELATLLQRKNAKPPIARRTRRHGGSFGNLTLSLFAAAKEMARGSER